MLEDRQTQVKRQDNTGWKSCNGRIEDRQKKFKDIKEVIQH